jgi:hydrogenase-4 component F
MPPFLAFFSKFFILLSLGSISPWVLALVLVLLFIAASAFGYFVIRTFGRTTPPGEPCEPVPYHTPLSMQAPIVILLALVLALGLMFPAGGYAFITQIVTELGFS